MLLASDKGLEILVNSPKCHTDGTLQKCPKLFYQILTRKKATKQPKNDREKEQRIQKIQDDFLTHGNFNDYFKALVHQVAVPYSENLEIENENDVDDIDEIDEIDEQDIIKVKKNKIDANIFDNVFKNDNFFNDYFINNINKPATSIQPPSFQPV
jgi:hypothetical protein